MLLDEPLSEKLLAEDPQAQAAAGSPVDGPNSADAPKPVSTTGAGIPAQEPAGQDKDMLIDGDGAEGMEYEDGGVSGDSSQDVSMGRSSQEQDDEATLEEEEVGLCHVSLGWLSPGSG